MTIPTRIFQTWKSKTVDSPVLKKWQESWTKYNPSYSYELWDDEDNRNFIKDNYPEFLEVFDSYPKNIQRADVIRYFYLYHFGGLYADLDFECLNSFDDITKLDFDVILGSMEFTDEKNFVHSIPNALMLAKPKSDFFLFLINVLKNIGINKDIFVEASTGPILLILCFLKYTNNYNENVNNFVLQCYGKDIFENISFDKSSKILILPENIFYPISWDKKDENLDIRQVSEDPKSLFPNSFAITYWMHSWG